MCGVEHSGSSNEDNWTSQLGSTSMMKESSRIVADELQNWLRIASKV